MLDDFSKVPRNLFDLHERSLLLEKRISFIDHGKDAGKFKLKGNEYRRLEEKILFLIWKFNPDIEMDIKSDNLWVKLLIFKEVRNNIVHPTREKDINLSIAQVNDFRETAISIIKLIAKKVWKQNLVV